MFFCCCVPASSSLFIYTKIRNENPTPAARAKNNSQKWKHSHVLNLFDAILSAIWLVNVLTFRRPAAAAQDMCLLMWAADAAPSSKFCLLLVMFSKHFPGGSTSTSSFIHTIPAWLAKNASTRLVSTEIAVDCAAAAASRLGAVPLSIILAFGFLSDIQQNIK